MVSERDFIVTQLCRRSYKRASTHARAQRAGIFFLPHVENKRAYIGFFDVVCDIFAVAIIFYGGEVGVLKAISIVIAPNSNLCGANAR